MAQAARTFRLFVSSTFSDLKSERSALQQAVFPLLRQLCLRLGCRFQDVDLRWGISEEAGLDQATMRVCLREVARCQETTPRPNFIILLGDRYGWCPLPPEIPATEYDVIARALPAAGRVLLDRWYARDDNSVPAVHRLLPRERDTPFEDDETWSREVERPLHDMLDVATIGWSDDSRIRYVTSATEQEIQAGAMRVPDAGEHVFCFVREMRELPEEARAAGFLDPDPAAHTKALALRAALMERLGPNVERYEARWLGRSPTPVPLATCTRALERAATLVRERVLGRRDAGDDVWRGLAAEARAPIGAAEDDGPDTSPISLDHLPALCVDVFLRLARIIVRETAEQDAVDERQREALAHQEFGERRAAVFAGRDTELGLIEAYVREGHPEPLCLVGEPGSGKTALLAHAATLVPEWLAGARTFVRFIGATPESTDGRTLLRSLWQALETTEPPGTFPELARGVPRLLEGVSPDRPWVIILDALDMVSPADRADRLAWLPRSVPPAVRLIISTTPGERADALRRRLPENRHIVLGALTEPEARWLLEAWLARVGRTLEPAQFEKIIEGFAHSPWPLYLKLAFEAAREWPSGVAPPPCGRSAEAMIAELFARLAIDANHGPMMVERSLAYLAAARHGLTEDELLDLLSRDAEVMASFRVRSPRSPRVARLPVVVWSRLYHDLQAYLAEQSADGTSVLTFYHQQVRRVAADRFLAPSAAVRHDHLARYFEEEKRLAVLARDGAAAFNLRKLSEQAYQETLGARWPSLAETLGNLDWLQAKVESGLGYDATADFSRGISALPPSPRAGPDPVEETRTVLDAFGRAFGQEFHTFQRWPRTAAQQMHNNLVAHAMAPDDPVATRLQAFAAAPYPRNAPWLRRLNVGPGAAVPRSLVRMISAHESAVTALAVSPDGAWLASGGGDGVVRVWDCVDGSEAASFVASSAGVVGLAWVGGPAQLRLATGGGDGRLAFWDWEAERAEGSIVLRDARLRCLLGLPDGRIVTGGDDFAVSLWDGAEPRSLHRHRDRVLCLATDRRGTFVASGSADRTVRLAGLGNGGAVAVLRGSERDVRSLAVDPDGGWLASGDETGAIRLWDVPTQTPRRTFAAHRHWVTCLAAVSERAMLLSGSTDRTIGVWDLETGLRRATLRGHRRGVTCLAAAPDQRWFATGGEDGAVCFWQMPDTRMTRSAGAEEHEAAVTALASLPAGGAIASASEDRTIRLWNAAGSSATALHGHVGPVTALATAAGRLVSAGEDRTVRIWHLDESGRVDILGGASPVQGDRPGHQRRVTCLVPLPGGSEVASAGDDGVVWIWDVRGARHLRRLDPVRGSLSAMAAGDRWIVAGGTPRELTVWDRGTGTVVRTFPAHEGQVTCLAALGPAAAVSGGLDGHVVHSDVASGETSTLGEGLGKLRCVAVDPDTGAIAAAGDTGLVWLWDPTRRGGPVSLSAHEEPVRALRFVPGGSLASASDEGRVCLWNPGDGKLLATVHAGAPVTSLLFQSPDRVWVATANAGVNLYQLIPNH